MAHAFKKMVYLGAEQERQIKQLARAARTSDTEIIRRAVAAYWANETAQIAADTTRVMEYVRRHPGGWDDEPSEWFKG